MVGSTDDWGACAVSEIKNVHVYTVRESTPWKTARFILHKSCLFYSDISIHTNLTCFLHIVELTDHMLVLSSMNSKYSVKSDFIG